MFQSLKVVTRIMTAFTKIMSGSVTFSKAIVGGTGRHFVEKA